MILDEIIKDKETELKRLKDDFSFDETLAGLKRRVRTLPAPRDFLGALRGGPENIRIIAEVKKASPSKGVIRSSFDPLAIARAYEENGAAAVSVLTDEKYFQGRLEYLTLIKNNIGLPVLRKDFIIDEYQVYESRAAGADAVLLIAAALPEERLRSLALLSSILGMASLVEVHDEYELTTALSAGAGIIGINNRDLRTFKTDIDTTIRLAPKVPKNRVLVTESGINTAADISVLKKAGVSAFLIGESLMREKDVGRKLRELLKEATP